MSFISNAVKGLGQGLGLLPSDPAPIAAPVAPTMATTSDAATAATLDDAALTQAKAMQRGRTSTMLTGGAGTLDDQKYTSKILLGR